MASRLLAFCAYLWQNLNEVTIVISDLLKEYKDIITLVLSATAAVISIVTYRRNKKTSYGKERLEAVVSPIFEIIERYLLRGSFNVSEKDCETIREIIAKNPLIAGGKYRPYRFLKPCNNIASRKLCKIVESDYDKLCRIYSIPLRSIQYRIENYPKSYSFDSVAKRIYNSFPPYFFFSSFIILSVGILVFALWQLYTVTPK